MAKEDVQQRREELKIRKGCIKTINDSFRLLNTERLALLADYSRSLEGIDEEALQIAEKQAIEICGYNPTADMSEHDWAAMQKRGKTELELEQRKTEEIETRESY